MSPELSDPGIPTLTNRADTPPEDALAPGEPSGAATALPHEADPVLRAQLQAELEQAVEMAVEEAAQQMRARLQAELPGILERALKRVRPG